MVFVSTTLKEDLILKTSFMNVWFYGWLISLVLFLLQPAARNGVVAKAAAKNDDDSSEEEESDEDEAKVF
jgi:hypothetical protein